MSDPLEGPITARQMALLLSELKEDFRARFAEQDRTLERRFAEQDARIERRLAEQDGRIERRLADQTGELEAIITSAVLGGADNVKRHLDRRLDDLTDRVEKLEGGGENLYRAPTRNDLG